MKNLNLVFKYIIGYKKRSFAIIFSVILSVSLIIGIGVLSDSAKEATINKIKLEQGSYHVKFTDLNKHQIKEVKKNKNIENIGLASYYDTTDTTNGLKVTLINADEEFFNLDSLNTQKSLIKEGKFPHEKDEIALEQWVMDDIEIHTKVGDKIILDLKDSGKKETFTLVGILNNRLNPQTTLTAQAFLALDNRQIDNNKKVTASIEFKNKTEIESNIKNIADKAHIKNNSILKNNSLLDSINVREKLDYKVIGLSIGIFIIAFFVIYGIFSISAVQRISEYGTLRAIGCSSTRLFNIIFQELICLSAIGILIGIFTGLTGAKVFSSISGGLFTEGIVEISKLTISLDIIKLAIIVILLDILLIAIVTSVNIQKISPIDSIKKNLEINKVKKASTNFLSEKLSFLNLISIRNIFRSKKIFFTIIASMSIGGILFILSGFYTNLSDNQTEKLAEISGFDSDYKINMAPGSNKSKGISSEDLNRIKNLDGVKDVTASKVIYSRMMLSKDTIAEPLYFESVNNSPYAKDIMNGMMVKNEKAKGKEDEYILKSTMYGYDDSLLKKLEKYVVKGKIDIKKMKNEDIAIIRIPHPYNTENKAPYVADIKIGDKIKVAFKVDGTNSEDSWRVNYNDEGYIYKELTVGAIVDELIDYDNYYTVKNSVDVVLSDSKFEQMTGFKNYRALSINKEGNTNNKLLNNKIKNIIKSTTGAVERNLTEELETQNILAKNKLIFMYSITIILFIISLFNIINNINYSVVSRVNEFGIMRAVGVNEKMFKKIFIFEGFIYGITSSIFCILGGIIGQVTMFKYMSPQLISPKFIVQWENYIFIIFINIFISILTTYVSSGKIRKLSVVDSIKSID